MTHPGIQDLMPGERVLWHGRPGWRALARDVLHVRLVALYFALFLIWDAYGDRSSGLGPAQTLLAGVPLLVLGAAMLAACAGFAWACARTTRYTITSERCIAELRPRADRDAVAAAAAHRRGLGHAARRRHRRHPAGAQAGAAYHVPEAVAARAACGSSASRSRCCAASRTRRASPRCSARRWPRCRRAG